VEDKPPEILIMEGLPTVLLVVGAAILWVIFLIRRGFVGVARIFRTKDALSPDNAKTIQELGIRNLTPWERMYKFPDYKPFALQFYITKEIVKVKEDYRYYLSQKAGESRSDEYQPMQDFKFYLCENTLANYYENSRFMKIFLPKPERKE